MLACVVPIFYFPKFDLSCQRFTPQEGYCRITSQSIFRRSSNRLPLNAIDQARVREYRRSRGGRTYQVQLETKTGIVNFGHGIGNGGESSFIAQRFNYFLQTPTLDQFQASEDHRGSGLFWALLMLGLGIGGLLWQGQVMELVLNRRTGIITLTYHGCLGKRVHTRSLRQIRAVRLDTQRTSKGYLRYRLYFEVGTGDDLVLRSFQNTSHQQAIRILEEIRLFLQLPPTSA